MTSILARNPNGAPCPVCGRGGENYQKFHIGDNTVAERESTLRRLASDQWYPLALELRDRRSTCHSCAEPLRRICAEYETAQAFAHAALALNPDNSDIQAIQAHFGAPSLTNVDQWLQRSRIMTFPDTNPIEKQNQH